VTDVQLLLWMAVIHVVGLLAVAVLMIPALRDSDPPADADGGSSDDGWGNLPRGKPAPSGWPGGGIPLPNAEQSRVRLRGPGRLSEELRRERERRPAREPERRPVRARPGHPAGR
jgi:hypothetical protein